MGQGENPANVNITRFSTLLPPEAIVVEASPAMWMDGLLPEEAACVERAVPKRQREFTAGRNCARQALQALGLVPAPPVRVGAQREPLFPQGVSGSITHTDDYCAAAVLRQGLVLSLGIDAEANEPLGGDLAGLIMLPAEQAMVRAMSGHGFCADKLVFSLKEAFYKAYFQVAGRYLDFLDACAEIDPALGEYTIRVIRPDVPEMFRGTRWRGHYGFDAKRVYSAITLSAGAGPPQGG